MPKNIEKEKLAFNAKGIATAHSFSAPEQQRLEDALRNSAQIVAPTKQGAARVLLYTTHMNHIITQFENEWAWGNASQKWTQSSIRKVLANYLFAVNHPTTTKGTTGRKMAKKTGTLKPNLSISKHAMSSIEEDTEHPSRRRPRKPSNDQLAAFTSINNPSEKAESQSPMDSILPATEEAAVYSLTEVILVVKPGLSDPSGRIMISFPLWRCQTQVDGRDATSSCLRDWVDLSFADFQRQLRGEYVMNHEEEIVWGQFEQVITSDMTFAGAVQEQLQDAPYTGAAVNEATFMVKKRHFCEIHGPQALLTTSVQSPTATSAPPNETGTSCANCSYNVPAATTTPPVLRSKWRDSTFATTRAPSNPLLRDACTRALAVESLPRGQSSGSMTLTTDLATQGPKDPRTVNVAHVFRLPDPRARGQRRAYAFVAVGSRPLFRHQMAVRRAFEAWAKSVVTLAETHLSTLQHGDSAEASPIELSAANVGSLRSYSSSATPSPPMSMGSAERTPPPLSPPQPQRPHSQASSFTASTSHPQKQAPTSAAVTPVSSFLSAKSVDPDGYPRSSLSAASPLANVPKTRSLAEIVGDEYFFVRLHAEFCGLLKLLIEREIAEKGPELDDGNDVIDEEDQRYGSGSDDDAVQSGDDDDDEDGGWNRY
ncbi:hypothetical protein E4T39_03379 [Aureobasidium subglaciale]|nr:hypothetical protein E4T39_03379 [Aureobasidium subglaciale]